MQSRTCSGLRGRLAAAAASKSPVLPATAGASYSGIQFETDAPASEINTCVPQNPQGCAVPPPNGPGHFHPYCTLAKIGGKCVWEFGHMSNGNTFGADAVRPPGGARVLQGPAGPRERGTAQPEETPR